MAGSLNKAILIGRVGKEPVISAMQNGKQVAKFPLATSESWRDKSGERQERTTWHQIIIYNEGLCKVVESYVHKGSNLYIEGAISNRSYEKDGRTVYVSEIVLQGFNSTLTMLDNPKGDKPTQQADTSTQGGFGGDLDDEVLF